MQDSSLLQIQYPLLCIIILRVIHIFVHMNNLLLFIAEWYSFVWIFHNVFIQFQVEEHLNYFQCLTIIDKASVDIHIHIPTMQCAVFSLG